MRAVDPGEQQLNAGPRVRALVSVKFCREMLETDPPRSATTLMEVQTVQDI